MLFMVIETFRDQDMWALQWRGYGVHLEVVPVVSSRDTQDVVEPHLDRPSSD